MNIKLWVFVLINILVNFNVFANNAPNKLLDCTATRQHRSNYEPEEFPTSNNLLRSSNEIPKYQGEKLIIIGKLLDSNCVPISDSQIFIWQPGNDGKYHYKPLRNVYKEEELNLNDDYTFVGAGKTITNNKGEFYFVSLYPASFKGIKPHINIRVKDSNLGTFNYRHYTSKQSPEDRPVKFNTPNYSGSNSVVNEVKIVIPKVNNMKTF